MAYVSTEHSTPRLTLTFLADQLGGGAGGGRFTTEFLRTLFGDPDLWRRLDRVFLLRTMSEPLDGLGPLPPNVYVVSRRFPSRLRGTAFASMLGRSLPRAHVAHGPFYYIFPSAGNSLLVTLHDLSFLNPRFHPAAHGQFRTQELESTLARCMAIVCTCDTILSECRQRWPQHKGHFVRIYDGAAPLDLQRTRAERLEALGQRPFILAVGTIEPRKNYDRLLEAYDCLVSQQGDAAPALVVVGRQGWMCDNAVSKLRELEAKGKAYWLQHAADGELADCYARASVFTYLSSYEGFGYPPFEAANAGLPMVLSDQSSVGEIWRDHACCVDPMNTADVLGAWQWAMGLDGAEREAVTRRQASRTADFTWQRCVRNYLDLYERLAGGSSTNGRSRATGQHPLDGFE